MAASFTRLFAVRAILWLYGLCRHTVDMALVCRQKMGKTKTTET